MGLSKPGIIIDANVFHKFVNANHKDSLPIHKCIKKGFVAERFKHRICDRLIH